jgi:hypothetical protein
MSAAATAAGYLYASGRLRGRASREGAENERPSERAQRPERPERKRREVNVAVYAPELEAAKPAAPRPAKTPKIQYRTRRWRPNEE